MTQLKSSGEAPPIDCGSVRTSKHIPNKRHLQMQKQGTTNLPYKGPNRVRAETGRRQDPPLTANDLIWALSLPLGADCDHKFSNPTSNQASVDNEIHTLPRCLVRGYGGDLLVDRQREFCRMLEARGVHLMAKFDEDGFHGVVLFKPAKATALYVDVFC
ncbi:hypothetical protein QQ045_000155 [Rhodiola kirilowii]